jgi:DNA-binding NarL/FixJ family response regulator
MLIRVALFEDNKLVRDSFEAILNGTEGFTCTGSFSACNDLVSDLNRSHPDVILMDIEMAGLNGIDATRMIHQQFPEMKVLIQTVFDDDEKIFAAICAGASGYLLKKTSPAKLIDAIREVYDGGAPMSPGVANKVLHLFQKFVVVNNASTDENALSPREKEILAMMMEGDNFHAIAKKKFISYDTVRTHVRHIYKKLHVVSVNQAIVKAFKEKLI